LPYQPQQRASHSGVVTWRVTLPNTILTAKLYGRMKATFPFNNGKVAYILLAAATFVKRCLVFETEIEMPFIVPTGRRQ